MAIFDDSKEEMVPLKGGDVATPNGMFRQHTAVRDPMGSGVTGASSGVSMQQSRDCTVVVRYQDKLLEVDVYAFPNAPIKLHLYCPRCGHALAIESDKKQMQLEKIVPQRVGDFVNMAKLSVEPFECTWELPDAGAHTPGIRVVPVDTLCRWKVGITNNIAKDA